MGKIKIEHSNIEFLSENPKYSEGVFLKKTIEMNTKRNTMQIIVDIKSEYKNSNKR